MESGIKFTLEKVVTNEMTARNMASGTLDVFATPSMIALIEETAWKSVAQEHDAHRPMVCHKLVGIASYP